MNLNNDNEIKPFAYHNPSGYKLNINHPVVYRLYTRFKKHKGIPQWCPLSDAQRTEFEAYIISKIKHRRD